ncbi:MAG TPA: alpha/beta hydrolase, partial [Bryobacteraceae bacterium]|nr:alpha/beta hydrolase [Bryobacteraceae bacterium]
LKTTVTLPVRGPERLPMNIVLHRPNDSVARPIFIDMYGGSWQRGTPHGAGRFHRLMASRGYAVFAIDYRHAPEHRFPAQLDDVQAAIAFIEENAGRYYADSKRVVLCGRSAGAHLALLAAYRPDSVPVNAVIAFYPPTDLAQGYDELPVPNPINVRYVLDQFLGGPPEKFPDAYRFASPSTYVRAGLPPTLLIHGGRDHVVKPEFSRAMHQRLVDAGNTSRLIEIPWAEHAFDAVWFGLGNRVAQPSIDSFLQTHAPAETKREP